MTAPTLPDDVRDLISVTPPFGVHHTATGDDWGYDHNNYAMPASACERLVYPAPVEDPAIATSHAPRRAA